MNTFLRLAFCTLAVSCAGAAQAATLRHVISFETTGIPNPAIVDITIDTSLLTEGTGLTSGLTLNSQNFGLIGAPLYDLSYAPYLVPGIFVYGAINGLGVGPMTADFAIFITGYETTAPGYVYSFFSLPEYQSVGATAVTIRSDIVAPAVPVPPALPLLASGLVLIGVMRNRRVGVI